MLVNKFILGGGVLPIVLLPIQQIVLKEMKLCIIENTLLAQTVVMMQSMQ